MKVFAALLQAARLLDDCIPHPRSEAEMLLSFILGSDRAYLLAHYHDKLDDSLASLFFALVLDRCQGKPLQFITGRQEFRGLEFKVTPDVLIPRPETELIVEEALRCVHLNQPVLVDLGTGSGCIAITLAVEVPQARILAIDLSGPALEIAKKNASRHNLSGNIHFLEGDLLSPLQTFDLKERIDCIVSNPPYVSEDDFPKLPREVREWEPKLALLAGNNGLEVYNRLIPQAKSYLKARGYLVLEIGFNMLDKVRGLLGPGWQISKIREDLNGIPRVVVAQKL
jgi:release factor glutamine methyltransferase